MKTLACLLRVFFHLLYHPLARTYDLVAWLVSFGRWKEWVWSVIPYIKGPCILELGHGPGHLQRALNEVGLSPFGMDESRQMGLLAHARLHNSGYTYNRITRGLAQFQPFASQIFDTIVATFPSEYIFDPLTLSEVHRTLKDDGQFIVLPVAWITGKNALDRFLAWLFVITGQTPYNPLALLKEQPARPLEAAGFRVDIKQIESKSSVVLLVLARK